MRHLLLSISLFLLPLFTTAAQAQVSISINVDNYPTLVQVPGYPVYYDPQLNSNYFFYDGLYWVYAGDTWYASTWYNGPWQIVVPESVPLFVLRVPVRYYRQPPVYFRGWQADAPPRWGDHWGQGWEAHRAGWDRWDRQAVPPPAPLPVYQRQYAGARYPRAPEQQQAIRAESYHYQPREAVTQQHYQQVPKTAESQGAVRPPPAPQHTQSPPSQRADVHPSASAPAPQHPQAPPPQQPAEVRPPPPASTPQHSAAPPQQPAEVRPPAPASAPPHAAAPPPQQRAEVRPPAPASAPPHAAAPPHEQAAQSPSRPPPSAPQQHENKAPPPEKPQEK
jgi:hypothetical protein